MDEREDALTEAQARSLWSRAADLQERARAEAERVAEGASPAIGDGAHEESTVSLNIAREAAIQSGIDGRYVDRALIQVRVDQELDTRATASWWARALRASDGTLSEPLHVEAPPSEVREAATAVAQSSPFAVELVDVLEPGPDATAYVYEVPEDTGKSGTFQYQVRAMSDVRRVALIVVPATEGGTDVELYCRLDNSVLINGIALRVIQTIAAAAGAGMGLALAALFVRLLGLEPTAVVSVLEGALGAIAALGAGTLAARAYRAFYRRQLRRTRESFRKLLLALRMRIDTTREHTDSS